MRTVTAIVANGDGFSQLGMGADFAVLTISRREVEGGLVGDVVDRLMRFTDSTEVVEHYEDRLTVAFTGYDDDPREIYEIAACVKFFRTLNSQWSYWYHFIEKNGPTMGVILRLLLDCRVQRRDGVMVGMEILDAKQLKTVMLDLFVAMNGLYEMHDFSEARIESMSARVMASINRFLG